MALFFNKNIVSLSSIKYIKNINKKLVIYKKLSKFLKVANIKNLKAESFKRYGSARKLYNFKVDNIGNY